MAVFLKSAQGIVTSADPIIQILSSPLSGHTFVINNCRLYIDGTNTNGYIYKLKNGIKYIITGFDSASGAMEQRNWDISGHGHSIIVLDGTDETIEIQVISGLADVHFNITYHETV